jgi:hypothetical protein
LKARLNLAQLVILDVNSHQEIETAFAKLVQCGAGALLTASGAFLIRAEPSADTPLLQQQQKKGSTRG